MKTVLKPIVLTCLLVSPLLPSFAVADDELTEQRINRLERIVKGQGLVSLLGRVDQLQQEVQRLNGDNEALRHQLDMMKKRQREMYIDLDGRFAQVQQPAVSVVERSVGTQAAVETVPETVVVGQQPEQNMPAASVNTAAAQVQSAATVEQASPVSVENGEAAYQAALQTLRSGQYEEAIAALSTFPDEYPQSHYLPNAYYWQGEAHYVLRNFDLAINAFQTVIDKFPVSSKVADAILKQGFSQYELGQVDSAKANLNTVITQYPTTSAARLAKVRLERIEKQVR